MTVNKQQNTCERCGHNNPPGALICRQCYALLVSGTTLNTTTSRLRGRQTGKLGDTDSTPSQTPIVKSALPGRTIDETIVLEVMASGKEIRHALSNGRAVIGRRDRYRHIAPEIDLEPHDAYRYGVSRTHAQLHREKDEVYLQDLGSANKTYLNDQQLTPHRPAEVNNGDTVRLGALVLQVRFE